MQVYFDIKISLQINYNLPSDSINKNKNKYSIPQKVQKTFFILMKPSFHIDSISYKGLPNIKQQNRPMYNKSAILERSNISPKSPRRIANKKQQEKSYIAKSFDYIDNGNDNNGQLNIDGGIGDYRMKIFRNKDKIKHYNDSTSIFKDKYFTEKIWEYASSGQKKQQQSIKHIKNDIQEPSSPIQKKLNNQRARIGLRRNNSIISPGLKPVQTQKSIPQLNLQTQPNSQLSKKLNDILSKPTDVYLCQPVQNVQEEDKNTLRKGIEQQLRQKQGHLFYRSIPNYMAQKWFKTLDNSTPDGNYVTPYVQEKPIPIPVKKPAHKRTHMFRFLQANYTLDRENKNKSTVTC